MFVVEVGSVLTTLLFVGAGPGGGDAPAGFILAVALWLWFTVLFANFAEAMAEGRGKAQADTLRKTRTTTIARQSSTRRRATSAARSPAPDAAQRATSSSGRGRRHDPRRRRGHRGRRLGRRERITGECAPVIRESGGDRSASPAARACSPTGSSCASPPNPGETFLDRMIALVEGAKRQKTPNEIALDILLAGADDHLPLVVVTLRCRAYQRHDGRAGAAHARPCSSRCSSA